MAGTRNKTAGNGYELKIVHELTDLGYLVKTTRNSSRELDALKVDVCTPLHITEDTEEGRVFPYYIQAKFTQNNPSYHTILDCMPKNRPGVLFHKKSEARKIKGGKVRHYGMGEYAIMTKELFYELFTQANERPIFEVHGEDHGEGVQSSE